MGTKWPKDIFWASIIYQRLARCMRAASRMTTTAYAIPTATESAIKTAKSEDYVQADQSLFLLPFK